MSMPRWMPPCSSGFDGASGGAERLLAVAAVGDDAALGAADPQARERELVRHVAGEAGHLFLGDPGVIRTPPIARPSTSVSITTQFLMVPPLPFRCNDGARDPGCRRQPGFVPSAPIGG